MKKSIYYLKKASNIGLLLLRNIAFKIKEQKKVLIKLPGSRKVAPLIVRYRLLFSIGSAIVVCLLLTVFSVSLYVITGTSKLDLSRPGYEEVRKKVTRATVNESAFGSNGPLNAKIVNDYLKKYKKQSQDLSKYDNFDPKLLDDAPLGLSSDPLPLPEPEATSP